MIRTTLAALVLTLIPAMSFAYSCSARGNQAQSCASGTVWDHSLQTCVEQSSS